MSESESESESEKGSESKSESESGCESEDEDESDPTSDCKPQSASTLLTWTLIRKALANVTCFLYINLEFFCDLAATQSLHVATSCVGRPEGGKYALGLFIRDQSELMWSESSPSQEYPGLGQVELNQ